MKRSLKTLRENKEILMIGAYGLESRDTKWKAKGLGEATGREFTLEEENPGRWRVNGTDSGGSRKRERFLARDLSEAVEQAERILFGGIIRAGHPQLRLSDAFFQSISSGNGSEEHKADYTQFAGYFCTWAQKRGLSLWQDLRFEHVKAYMQDCIERRLAAKSVSRYLEPIRSTARYMAANWPEAYRDICLGLRLPANIGCTGVFDENEGNPVLLFDEILDFFSWLETYEHAEVLQPAVLLMGICGFQLREALRLQNDEVDLATGTATVQAHRNLGEVVKNPYRIRRIPLPAIVVDYLTARPNHHVNVVPYDLDDNAFGKLLKRAMIAWKSDCPLAPKDLRNTLQTHALEHGSDEGWNKFLVDQYVGHAPKTQMEKHYFGDKKKRMVDVFLEHVVAKIDQVVDGILDDRAAKWHKMARSAEMEVKLEEENPPERHKMARPVSIVPFLRADTSSQVA